VWTVIKAQIPAADPSPVTAPVAVGSRYVYTTPDGRHAHYRVTELTGAESVTLQADEPEWGDVTIRQEGLATSYGWAQDEQATP
jgi:hypothetical protein